MEKSTVAMVCITALGVVKLCIDGDGAVLTAAVAAIAALAGVEVGKSLNKSE